MTSALYQRAQAALLAGRCSQYDRSVASWKRALFGPLEGTIVEIGPGMGVSLPFFRRDVRWIGIEPNPFLHADLRRAAAKAGIAAEVRDGTADALPFSDASADAVVCSLVLCTVPDVDAALEEIRRILRPGGRFAFIEHVAAPAGTLRRRVQRVARPLWGLFAGGCHPDRETWTNIERAGFASAELTHFRVRVPVVGPHIAGVAVK